MVHALLTEAVFEVDLQEGNLKIVQLLPQVFVL